MPFCTSGLNCEVSTSGEVGRFDGLRQLDVLLLRLRRGEVVSSASAPSGLSDLAAAKKPSVGASSAIGTASSMIGHREEVEVVLLVLGGITG